MMMGSPYLKRYCPNCGNITQLTLKYPKQSKSVSHTFIISGVILAIIATAMLVEIASLLHKIK